MIASKSRSAADKLKSMLTAGWPLEAAIAHLQREKELDLLELWPVVADALGCERNEAMRRTAQAFTSARSHQQRPDVSQSPRERNRRIRKQRSLRQYLSWLFNDSLPRTIAGMMAGIAIAMLVEESSLTIWFLVLGGILLFLAIIGPIFSDFSERER